MPVHPRTLYGHVQGPEIFMAFIGVSLKIIFDVNLTQIPHW